MKGLALQIQAKDAAGTAHWEWVTLDDDTAITIVMSSPIFGKGATFSYPFTIPIEPNRHIIGNADQIHGAHLHDILHKRPARLYLCGIPFRKGIIKLDRDVKVSPKGKLQIEFTSERGEWSERIEGMKAREVSVRDDICIGMALWRERQGFYNVKLKGARVYLSSSYYKEHDSDLLGHWITKGEKQDVNVGPVALLADSGIQRWPKYVLPKGSFNPYPPFAQGATVDACNVTEPFAPSAPELHPYCNIRVCYQKHELEKQNDSWEEVTKRGYDVSDAERPNSAPNFYVLYWLYRLFKDKGIAVVENALEDIEDMRRLFFVNTNCAYADPGDLLHSPGRYGMYAFPLPESPMSGNMVSQDDGYGLNLTLVSSGTNHNVSVTDMKGRAAEDNHEGHCKIEAEWNSSTGGRSFISTAIGHKAFATSENYPDAEVKEVLQSLEAMFGVRFLFDDAFTQVRIVLLRDILKDTTVKELHAEVYDIEKEESNIRGFRMTYNGGEDDTSYNYTDYSQLRSDVPYSRLINSITSLDKTCYYTPNNGDAYRIKVDKDAKNYSELNASLMEVGQFCDAEDGDCTGDDETIETINIKAKPAIMNDVNFIDERKGVSSEQRFALYVDADMKARWPYAIDENGEVTDASADTQANSTGITLNGVKNVPEWGLMAITGDGYFKKSDIPATLWFEYEIDTANTSDTRTFSIDVVFDLEGVINEGYFLHPFDNYDPTDDGGCPLEQQDWGLTLGIMRGGGGSSGIVYFDHNYDGEGNSRWAISAGSKYAAHPDVCDNYGNTWDYNGRVEISSRSAASEWLTEHFSSTAQNAMMERYPVTVGELYTAGWRSDLTVGGLHCVADRVINSSVTGDNNSELVVFRGTFGGRVIVFTPVVWYATRVIVANPITSPSDFLTYLQEIWGDSTVNIIAHDQAASHMILAVDPTDADYSNLLRVRERYFGISDGTVYVDNGLGSLDRFSLKLRMEKPNPNFNPSQPEGQDNPCYLPITDPLNARRGLIDVFYSEYSHFVRNRRIAHMKMGTELAELLSIDFTKHYHVADITGLLNEVTIEADMEGIDSVKGEMFYL